MVPAIYLFNQRFNESTDTFGYELLPISILEHHTLTFDQYYVGRGVDGRYPTGAQALAPIPFSPADAYRVSPETASESVPWWFVRTGGGGSNRLGPGVWRPLTRQQIDTLPGALLYSLERLF